jgi:xanthine dehydrogenase accessory factor
LVKNIRSNRDLPCNAHNRGFQIRQIFLKRSENMKKALNIPDMRLCIRGGGDIASGVAWRLHHCGLKVLITEIDQPMAVRRKVAFCEAIHDGSAMVEGVEAIHIRDAEDVYPVWDQGKIAVLVDPLCESRDIIDPEVVVDAILAKKNIGTSLHYAPLVIALGPGFEAGMDAHFVVETKRGHNLGRLLGAGSAAPNTGIPGPIMGITTERVLRAPVHGLWQNKKDIGDAVSEGDTVGSVAGEPVKALISGVVRGMIRPGIRVTQGLKIGDIDPRGVKEFCYTISEKALAIAGGVLEGIMRFYVKQL